MEYLTKRNLAMNEKSVAITFLPGKNDRGGR